MLDAARLHARGRRPGQPGLLPQWVRPTLPGQGHQEACCEAAGSTRRQRRRRRGRAPAPASRLSAALAVPLPHSLPGDAKSATDLGVGEARISSGTDRLTELALEVPPPPGKAAEADQMVAVRDVLRVGRAGVAQGELARHGDHRGEVDHGRHGAGAVRRDGAYGALLLAPLCSVHPDNLPSQNDNNSCRAG